MVDKKFIINIGDKEFVKFEGLLDAFHKNGGRSIDTEIVNTDPLIFKATVKGKSGSFSGMGDADDTNVGALVSKHKIRMAETRAIARALRWYTNIGMCSAEELGGDVGPSKPSTQARPPEPKKQIDLIGKCAECNIVIPQVVEEFSVTHFNKALCRPCQEKEKKKQSGVSK